MEALLTEQLSSSLNNFALVSIFLVFVIGVITSIGPCNIAMIPILMAYVGGNTQTGKAKGFWLSLFFTLGTSTTFTLLGLLASIVGGVFRNLTGNFNVYCCRGKYFSRFKNAWNHSIQPS